MNKREFIQQATLQFGAALCKVYDEQAAGLVENIGSRSMELAADATTLAFDLAEKLGSEYCKLFHDEIFDDEIRIRIR